MRIKMYEEIDYADVELEESEAFSGCRSRYVRLSVPSGLRENVRLARMGFVMVDRTIEVKVPLTRGKVEFENYCRLPVERTEGRTEVIGEIAQNEFSEDSRFLLALPQPEDELRGRLLDSWVDELEESFLCQYKGSAIGFAGICFPERYGGMPFIHLAAVEQKYRATGSAMSLYAAVFAHYRGQGARAAYGRISSRNMAVMNLYAAFGAQFAKPYDVYLKEACAAVE